MNATPRWQRPEASQAKLVRALALLFFISLLLVLLDGGTVWAGPADLDPSFDGDGRVTTNFGESEEANAIVLQPDGRIVAAGGAGGDFALARYNPDGSLDPSFDGDGKLTTDLGRDGDRARALALQPDGKIVVAGASSDGSSGGSPNPPSGDFALARYNPDGSLDTTFDSDGTLTTDIGGAGGGPGDRVNAVVLQGDGRIVVAGGSRGSFALARYNPDGSLDTTFDSDGKLTTSFGAAHEANALAIEPDGAIVAAGGRPRGDDASFFSPSHDFALARYNPACTPACATRSATIRSRLPSRWATRLARSR